MAEDRRIGGIRRSRFLVTGTVQGVGFRPFVYRLARGMGLGGWVRNSPSGVEIEAEGGTDVLARFEKALGADAPPLAVVAGIVAEEVPAEGCGCRDFMIRPSAEGDDAAPVPPDTALCDDCLTELFDPADRRHHHPFITCTNCGPRYSIITAVPYDRPATTMAHFPLCEECRREYEDPGNRRFHAQPLCCPACGPRLRLLDPTGATVAAGGEAVTRAAEALQRGEILAVKGVGGFHLAVDAASDAAVRRLREAKHRDQKPFAVMVPDLETARRLALLASMEERLLAGPEAPVVIVRRRDDAPLSGLLAPGNRWIGLMLPYTPIHHLLLAGSGKRRQTDAGVEVPAGGGPSRLPSFEALVMTSANLSDEPIASREDQLLELSPGVADLILTHDRPILVPQDDSVMRVFMDRPLFYRRSRGRVPAAVRLPFPVAPLVAVGSEQKNVLCLARGDRAVLSQHIGDLKNSRTCDMFRQALGHLSSLLRCEPVLAACDLHPDYLSTMLAGECGLPLVPVQHHHAHLAACMAEHRLEGEVVGIILDGTGYGPDGTVWGGEILTGGYGGYHRAAHLARVRLPGGDRAVEEPWRMALACLYPSLGKASFDLELAGREPLSDQERELLAVMLERGVGSPFTSSCGRLFDAAASLLGLRQKVSYDGQAAIELEGLAETVSDDGSYRYSLSGHGAGAMEIDLLSLFPEMLTDADRGVPRAVIARRFHASVAAALADCCLDIAGRSSLPRVVLSGGVFQNRLLTEMIYTRLTREGLQVYSHRLVPPNDGGIALGQAAVAGFGSL